MRAAASPKAKAPTDVLAASARKRGTLAGSGEARLCGDADDAVQTAMTIG